MMTRSKLFKCFSGENEKVRALREDAMHLNSSDDQTLVCVVCMDEKGSFSWITDYVCEWGISVLVGGRDRKYWILCVSGCVGWQLYHVQLLADYVCVGTKRFESY